MIVVMTAISMLFQVAAISWSFCHSEAYHSVVHSNGS